MPPTQPPAAPESETGANGLTEAEREALTRCDCGHDIGGEHNSYGCYGGGPACGCNETDDRPGVNFAAVERIVAERVRVVEGERDAARRERNRSRRVAEHALTEAESAEAAHRALQAAVEALAKSWADEAEAGRAGNGHPLLVQTYYGHARDLRALLAGGAR